MARDITKPDPGIVLELLFAFRQSKTMFAAVELGVFDTLATAPDTGAKLAERLKCAPAALTQLLDACVGLGLLVFSNDHYANSPVAATYLTSNSTDRLTGYVRYSNDVMWKMWGHLADAVREGTHRWEQTYGWEGPIFTSLYRTEEARREFLMGMHGFGLISSPHVVSAFDLSGFQHLVDLGGATGHLAVAACQRYSTMRATVFDLAQVLPLAREITGTCPVASKIDFVAGDFFVDRLPEGDLFALGRIVHDWSEEKIVRLLSRIANRLPKGGGILIAEKLLQRDKSGPQWAQMQSLNMLICTEGRERTLEEYEQLLVQSGFRNVQGCRTQSPLDAIIATKG